MKDQPEKKSPANRSREPLHIKTSGEGMFFKKGSESPTGHFFRDLPGRRTGDFHKTAEDGDTMPVGVDLEAGDASPPGSEMGGGMYGTGTSEKKKGHTKLTQVIGQTRPATKVASAAPSDWEADVGLPTGMHRPAHEQPEALETGGERFHSTQAKAPSVGAEPSVRHGVVEGGSMHLAPTSGHQLGKHAAPRFLGTGFAKNALDRDDLDSAGGYVADRAREIGSSIAGGARDAAGSADSALKSVTRSPLGATLAAVVAGKLGLSAIKGVGRGAARVLGHKPIPKPGLVGQAMGGLRKLVTGK